MASYCFISAQFLPNLGGVENYTYNLSKKLIEKGHHVSVLTMNNHAVQQFENIEGIDVYRLPCINLLNGRYPIPKYNKEWSRVFNKFASSQYDRVVINTRFYVLSLVGARWAKKKHIKTIIIEHGTQHLTVNHVLVDKIGELYEHFITKLIYHYQKDYYGVSKECNKWLQHFGILAKGVLYNSVDLEKIEAISSNNPFFIEEIQQNEEAVLISFTGRLVKEKGVMNLVEAVNRINQKDKNVYLAIAGDGPLLAELNEMKNEHIFVLGRLSFDKVVALLNQSQIFCLPSESEGFPTSVLEAIACKNYIITTEKGGAKELITSSEYGVILKNNEVDGIVDAITYAVNHREFMCQAVQKSYEKLVKSFTWEHTVQALLKIMG